jgi:hypothetical protein
MLHGSFPFWWGILFKNFCYNYSLYLQYHHHPPKHAVLITNSLQVKICIKYLLPDPDIWLSTTSINIQRAF